MEAIEDQWLEKRVEYRLNKQFRDWAPNFSSPQMEEHIYLKMKKDIQSEIQLLNSFGIIDVHTISDENIDNILWMARKLNLHEEAEHALHAWIEECPM